MEPGGSNHDARLCAILRRLWNAAACCRFDPASLLAATPARTSVALGQQAGPDEREKRRAALQSTRLLTGSPNFANMSRQETFPNETRK
jgi:hypothetical protein